MFCFSVSGLTGFEALQGWLDSCSDIHVCPGHVLSASWAVLELSWNACVNSNRARTGFDTIFRRFRISAHKLQSAIRIGFCSTLLRLGDVSTKCKQGAKKMPKIIIFGLQKRRLRLPRASRSCEKTALSSKQARSKRFRGL